MTEKAATPSLKTRVLSGLVLAPLVIAIIIVGSLPFYGMLAIAFGISLYEWFNISRHMAHGKYITFLAGIIYFTVCFGAYLFLREEVEQGAWLALCVMFTVWASDMGGYFVGRKIGGKKLAPAISPKKTWSGFAGAVLASGVVLALLLATDQFFARWIAAETLLPVWFGFITGCFLGAVGQVGDLFISLFKRRAHLKDSGHLIPGHGGLLDRIDALLLVCPVFVLILFLWSA